MAPRVVPTPSGASARKSETKKGEETAAAAEPSPTTAVVTGASLSADELCAASGLTLDELAGLKGFGLLECVTVAGIESYDEDALTVANLAAAFRAFGIEPRHLGLLELQARDCRYPYGGDADGEAITFCGHPRRAGSSYCASHFHLTRGIGSAPERSAIKVLLRLVEAA